MAAPKANGLGPCRSLLSRSISSWIELATVCVRLVLLIDVECADQPAVTDSLHDRPDQLVGQHGRSAAGRVNGLNQGLRLRFLPSLSSLKSSSRIRSSIPATCARAETGEDFDIRGMNPLFSREPKCFRHRDEPMLSGRSNGPNHARVYPPLDRAGTHAQCLGNPLRLEIGLGGDHEISRSV